MGGIGAAAWCWGFELAWDLSVHLGLTYDLKQDYLALGFSDEQVAEFDRVETIDAIASNLAALGHRVTRIGHASSLITRIARGERWDLVFNIAEGVRGSARESQVPAILDVADIPYTFSDPLTLAVCLDKRLTKHVVRAAGLPTPDFAVIEALDELDGVSLGFPLFAKPIAEGTSRGITPASKVRDAAQLRATCAELLDRYRQPVLIEHFLPGREFTVGIVGSGSAAWAVGALEVHLAPDAEQEIYTYDNKQRFEGRVHYTLATDAEAQKATVLALRAYRLLGCRDAGRIDLRSDALGEPAFIEANPLAGLNPEISDLAILARLSKLEYRALIEAIVTSATARLQRG